MYVYNCVTHTCNVSFKRSKSNFRGLLLEELTKNGYYQLYQLYSIVLCVLGVKFSVRNLNIGDFLWIAKEIVNADPGT